MAYAKSLDIRVYPTAWRGANASTEKTFNPEASLNTEENLSNLSNRLAKVTDATRLDSYVVSYDSTSSKMVFVIHGYIFELGNVSNLSAPLWAKIKVLSAPTTYKGREFSNPTLACLENGSSDAEPAVAILDLKDGAGTADADYYFHGVQFSDTEISGDAANGVYVLQLLDDNSLVPAKSWLVMETSQIKDTSSGNPMNVSFSTGSLYAQTISVGSIFAGSMTIGSAIYTPAVITSVIGAGSGTLSMYAGSMNLSAYIVDISAVYNASIFASNISLTASSNITIYGSKSVYINTSDNLWFGVSKSVIMEASKNLALSAHGSIYATASAANPVIQLSAISGSKGIVGLYAGSGVDIHAYSGTINMIYGNNATAGIKMGAYSSKYTTLRLSPSLSSNNSVYFPSVNGHLLTKVDATNSVGNGSRPVYINEKGVATVIDNGIKAGYGDINLDKSSGSGHTAGTVAWWTASSFDASSWSKIINFNGSISRWTYNYVRVGHVIKLSMYIKRASGTFSEDQVQRFSLSHLAELCGVSLMTNATNYCTVNITSGRNGSPGGYGHRLVAKVDDGYVYWCVDDRNGTEVPSVSLDITIITSEV